MSAIGVAGQVYVLNGQLYVTTQNGQYIATQQLGQLIGQLTASTPGTYRILGSAVPAGCTAVWVVAAPPASPNDWVTVTGDQSSIAYIPSVLLHQPVVAGPFAGAVDTTVTLTLIKNTPDTITYYLVAMLSGGVSKVENSGDPLRVRSARPLACSVFTPTIVASGNAALGPVVPAGFIRLLHSVKFEVDTTGAGEYWSLSTSAGANDLDGGNFLTDSVKRYQREFSGLYVGTGRVFLNNISTASFVVRGSMLYSDVPATAVY